VSAQNWYLKALSHIATTAVFCSIREYGFLFQSTSRRNVTKNDKARCFYSWFHNIGCNPTVEIQLLQCDGIAVVLKWIHDIQISIFNSLSQKQRSWSATPEILTRYRVSWKLRGFYFLAVFGWLFSIRKNRNEQKTAVLAKWKVWLDLPGPPDPPVRNTENLDIIFHSNVVGVFEVCLELPSDLKAQFGFVAGEFSELEQTRKSLACLIPVWPQPSRNHSVVTIVTDSI